MATAAASVTMIYRSTIGKKVIMAVTGMIYIGYVFMHMYGNLKIFLGAAYFNEYAEGLRELGHPVFGYLHILTLARIVLIVAMVLHVWSAVTLTLQARKARPQGYAEKKIVQANYASLTMRYGGIVILLFVIYHLAHLTWGITGVPFERGDPYFNVVSSFQIMPIPLIYLAAVAALGLHLYHGTWSMLQTLGLSRRSNEKPIRAAALVLAILIAGGFAAVPLGIMFGIVQL